MFISVRQSSYNSLYTNPLTELNNRSCSEGGGRSTDGVALGVHICRNPVALFDDKENAVPNKDKENVTPSKGSGDVARQFPNGRPRLRDRALKPSSLQLCMQKTEPDWTFGAKIWDPTDTDNNHSVNIWDYSDSEAAPASSWSTLPNRSFQIIIV